MAYIFSFRISRQGVIRNVSLDFTESTIKDEIDYPFKIFSVQRFNRKVTDLATESVSYIASKSIAITFKGQNISKYLYLWSNMKSVP